MNCRQASSTPFFNIFCLWEWCSRGRTFVVYGYGTVRSLPTRASVIYLDFSLWGEDKYNPWLWLQLRFL
jgi:hypothetical protein